MVYDASDFKLQIMNVQKGITVKKAFINDAAGKYHNPVSGRYWFGVYDNSEGTGTPLEKISITYLPGETTEKTAKFKNRDLNTQCH